LEGTVLFTVADRDSSNIRRAAIRYRVPYITTTAAAIAAAKGIAARREGAPKVRSLQNYHARID
jgi:carbamoyl-phosphate synthase large subunit